MAYTVTNTFVRPNTDVAWFTASNSVRAHMKDEYGLNAASRTKNNFTSTESEDGLTLTNVSVFVNKAAFDTHTADSTNDTFISQRTTYNRNKSIQRTVTVSGSYIRIFLYYESIKCCWWA